MTYAERQTAIKNKAIILAGTWMAIKDFRAQGIEPTTCIGELERHLEELNNLIDLPTDSEKPL